MKSKTPRSKSAQSNKSRGAMVAQRRVDAPAAAMSPPATPESQSVPRAAPAKSISGQVVEERSGLALAGVTVRWTLRDPSTRTKARQVELGSATTNADGRFFIEAGGDAQTQAALCLAQHSDAGNDSKTTLSLVDRSGKTL